ncbi:MAG: NTP transferase domain-containing protein [Nocardioidaceae bacterium]
MRSGGPIGGIVLAGSRPRRFRRTSESAQEIEPALRAMAASPLGPIVLVLPAIADQLVEELDLRGADPVLAEPYVCQAALLARGLAELDGAAAVVVALADGTLRTPDVVRRLLAARGRSAAVRASYLGRPAHPLLLEQELIARLRDATGDRGARNVIASSNALDVPCDDLVGDLGDELAGDLDALAAGPVA